MNHTTVFKFTQDNWYPTLQSDAGSLVKIVLSTALDQFTTSTICVKGAGEAQVVRSFSTAAEARQVFDELVTREFVNFNDVMPIGCQVFGAAS
jgi:hypothetical protein